MWYFEEGGVVHNFIQINGFVFGLHFDQASERTVTRAEVFYRSWCGTLKRVVWYFEDGCMVL